MSWEVKEMGEKPHSIDILQGSSITLFLDTNIDTDVALLWDRHRVTIE